jgi:mRNA-degrading endonuclease RelE of RelBE toxin-antitoxin system
MDFRIADTFTDSLARLTGDEQKAVKTTAFDLQLNPASPGMSFHKLDKAKDKNFWSVRATNDIRLIVHRSEESFFVRHAYFLGANDPYGALKTTRKAEINEEAWATLNRDTSRPFDKPKSGRIAVKVINHLGDEVMKVFRVT